MITRSKMRRQLYRGGGIAGLYPRQKYGVGDFVRKLIPNEIADVAVKAAPFVAPFNPAVAGLMRGIGRYDQRGNLSDAFKQGILTYGGGQLARGIGGAPLQGNPFIKDGAFRGGLEGFKSGFSSPLSPERTQSFKNLFKGKDASNTKNLDEFRFNAEKFDEFAKDAVSTAGTEGVTAYKPSSLKNIWNTWQNMDPGMKTAIVGVGSGSLAGLAQWFENQIPQEPGESMDEYLARRKVAVGKLMRQYMENTRAYDSAWTSMTDQQKDETVAKANMNQGGRVGQMHGTGPAGLPGIPRMAPDGMEFDMRQNGGFQGLGAKEGKDDVPAMLAKNEFVFTADAVKGAGGGDVELGAQRMYDTMKNLEKRMA